MGDDREPRPKDHWEHIYARKDQGELSWFQEYPSTSLDFISRITIPKQPQIIDVGGGASRVVDGLLACGYCNVTVLDVAHAALDQANRRLG